MSVFVLFIHLRTCSCSAWSKKNVAEQESETTCCGSESWVSVYPDPNPGNAEGWLGVTNL